MLEVYLVGATLCAILTIWRTTVNPVLAAHPLVAKVLGSLGIIVLWPVTLVMVVALMWEEHKRRG